MPSAVGVLSIGVSAKDVILVGTSEVLVRAIISPTLILVQVDSGPDVVVTDKEQVSILPDVKVFAGMGKRSVGSRLVFTAPKSIGIGRKKEAA